MASFALRSLAPDHLAVTAAGAAGSAVRVASRGLPARVTRRVLGVDGDPLPVEVDPDDPPWCEPGGPSWTIHADIASLVGGVLSLWTQALHPGSLAGVMDHSDFAADPLGRLQRTGGFVTTTTFAPGSQAAAACAAVRQIHTRVRGTTPGGRPYAAGDPELLDWVHCALLVSMGRTWRLYGDRPDRVDLDAYVAEQARVPIELGDPDPPTTWAGLLARLDEHRPQLEVNHQTRWIGRWFGRPSVPGPAFAGLLPAYRVVLAAAVAAAPAWARQLWGVPSPRWPGIAAGRLFTSTARGLLGPPQVPAAA